MIGLRFDGIHAEPVRLSVGAEGSSEIGITVGEAARVRFVLDYSASAEIRIRFDLLAGAYVDVFHLDHHGKGDVASRSVYALREHASLNVWTFASGGTGAIEHRVEFQKPHGFASVNGLSLLNQTTRVTHRVQAVHQASHCVSRQLYKSILAQQSRSEFESLVEVAPHAQKSDSRQMNKNLLLSREARAFSSPQLRIDADDVSCAHGSATGELNRDEIFYARTRGISEADARTLMIGAFAGEVLELLPEIPLKITLVDAARLRIPQLTAA